jgi:hypothetical protein
MCSGSKDPEELVVRQAVFFTEVGKAIPHFAARLGIELYDSSRSVEYFYGRGEEIALITVEGL